MKLCLSCVVFYCKSLYSWYQVRIKEKGCVWQLRANVKFCRIVITCFYSFVHEQNLNSFENNDGFGPCVGEEC